jgi:hypothetical protein
MFKVISHIVSNSNREWSRQYVDAPFFSRFAPAIELDLDGPLDSDTRSTTGEDANIRAAQAILFRSRSKAAYPTPTKEDRSGGMNLKTHARGLGPLTPGKRIVSSPAVVSKIGARLDATPVVKAIDVIAGTPSSPLFSSGSKQRYAILVVQIECGCSLNQSSLILLQIEKKMVGKRVQYNQQ